MRLQRSRRGKTPIDVVRVEQDKGVVRIRLTMGNPGPNDGGSHKNTDLTPEEAEDLATMLLYFVKVHGNG